MKFLQILFIFAAFQVTFQQDLRCYSCNNCNPDRSLWGPPLNCNTGDIDDDNVGPPTTPGSPLGFSAKNVSLGATNEIQGNLSEVTTARSTSPSIARNTWRCFMVVYDLHGTYRTDRGCVRQADQDGTCSFHTDMRISRCILCDHDRCNSGSGQLAYSLFLIAAFYILWNALS